MRTDSGNTLAHRPGTERGQITAFLVVLTTCLLLLVGLVGDGGRALADRVEAVNLAQEAARAAAQAVDLGELRRTGRFTLDSRRARLAARAYLTATPRADQITTARVSVRGDQVTVTVGLSDHTVLLQVAGLTTIRVTGTGSARAERNTGGRR